MPRYVILYHQLPEDAPRESHWDLMLEHDGALRTWALCEVPCHACSILALALPDHRLTYLDYEGPVSGNRGIVSRYDFGQYELLSSDGDSLSIGLRGERLLGTLRLSRHDSSDHWRVEYRRAGQ